MEPTRTPELTVIVNFYNMRREARRTLYTLTPAYQQGVSADRYRVVAIDNGSSEPLDADEVRQFGDNFDYIYEETNSLSPASALNRAIRQATTPFVMCAIDGARMLSPRVLYYTLTALQAFEEPFVYTMGMHLGEQMQNEALLAGYNQEVEDRLLETVDWRENGYRLFSISSLAASSNGFFSKVAESNCFAIRRETLLSLGGFDEGFVTPGGGLVNLDIFKQIVEHPDVDIVALLGEATFHQFHGGVSTNVARKEHPLPTFKAEYARLRGCSYHPPDYTPHFWGKFTPECGELRPQMPLQTYLEIAKRLTENQQIEATFAVLQQASTRWPHHPNIYFAIGNTQRASGDTDGAIASYHKALELDRLRPAGVYVTLGNVYSDRGELDEACKHYQQALDLEPDHFFAYLSLGNALSKHGDFDAAIAAYDRARAIEAENSFLHFSFGSVYRKQGKPEAAIASFRQALEYQHERPVGIYQNLADVLNGQGQTAEAIAICHKALELEPNRAHVHLILGNAYRQQGQIEDAIAAYQTARDLNHPNPFGIYRNLGEILRQQGKTEEAIAAYEAASELQPNNTGISRRIEELKQTLKETLKETPPQPETPPTRTAICLLGMHRSGTSSLAGSLQQAGLPAGEIDEWSYDNLRGNRENREIMVLNDLVLAANDATWDNPPKQLQWGREHQQRRDAIVAELDRQSPIWMFKEPRSVLTLPFWCEGIPNLQFIGIFRHPIKVAMSLYQRSQMPLRQGIQLWLDYNRIILERFERTPFPLLCFDLPESEYVAQLEEAIETLNTQLHGQLTLCPRKAGEFYTPELVQQKSAISVHASDFEDEADVQLLADAQTLYRQLQQAAGITIEEANTEGVIPLAATIEACENALKTQPENSQLYFMLGNAQLQEEQTEDAIASFQTAIELDPHYFEAYRQLGVLLCNRQRYNEAIALYQQALCVQADNPQIYWLLGIAEQNKGDLDRAISSYQKALELAPKYTLAYLNLGGVLARIGQLENALECYRKALELRPKDPQIHIILGNYECKRENWQGALESYQKALELNPPNASDVYLFIADVLIRQNQVDRAIEQCQKVLQLDPTNPKPYGSLGRIESQQGNLDAAISLYQKAIKLQHPQMLKITLELVEVLKKNKQIPEAISACHRAIAIDSKAFSPYFILAGLQRQEGNLEAAIVAYQKALDTNPEQSCGIYQNLADTLVKQGRIEEAIASCQKALELEPDRAHMYLILGNAYRKQNNIEEAIAAYQKALELKHPQPFQIYKGLGEILSERGQTAEAISAYQEASRLQPKNTHILRCLERLQIAQ